MSEVADKNPATVQEKLRLWGTLVIFLVVFATTIVVGMQNRHQNQSDVTVAPGTVEAQLVLERTDRLEYLQGLVKVVQDGDKTYYLMQDKSWQTERPHFLDENDQAILTPDHELYFKGKAAEIALNNTIVGSSPAWMGFGTKAITFEENSDRFRMLEVMLWTGFLCSMPLYALLFKRKQLGARDWGLTLIGLFCLGFLPVILASTRPTIYLVAYGVPLISMLLLWRLTRQKKEPIAPASTNSFRRR